MPKAGTMSKSSLEITDSATADKIFTIKGAQISEIYQKNKMGVHFQGMSFKALLPAR
jgi:hypothetical protein